MCWLEWPKYPRRTPTSTEIDLLESGRHLGSIGLMSKNRRNCLHIWRADRLASAHPWSKSPVPKPLAVRLYPFRTLGWRIRKRKVEDGNALPIMPAYADCNDLVGLVQVDALDGDEDPEHQRLEGNCQALLDHREPAP